MSEDSSDSKNYFLRTVIIIAFGVPVLLEVLTFFNLIKFRFWDDGSNQEASSQKSAVTEVREYAPGDTLFTDSGQIITIREMHIYVNPEAWNFELSLGTSSPEDTSPQSFQLTIDSLSLDNNNIIRKTATWKPEPNGESSKEDEENEHKESELEWEADWNIPNGRLPQHLFVTWQRKVNEDSIAVIHKDFLLKKPPIRYHN